MVLESDMVYDAIQIVSENGYVVIEQNFFSIVLSVGIAFVFFMGFLFGFREWKKFKKEQKALNRNL
jgi:hypothetical protein